MKKVINKQTGDKFEFSCINCGEMLHFFMSELPVEFYRDALKGQPSFMSVKCVHCEHVYIKRMDIQITP